jgi:hypothetical protein
MRWWIGAVGLPVFLIAAICVEPARAGDVPPLLGVDGYPVPAVEPAPMPGPFVPPTIIDPKTSIYVPVNPADPPPRLGRRLLNHFNFKCRTSFLEPTCQSCWQDLRFIFGSCKVFFGEPCMDRRPPVLLPDGVELPDGKGCRNCGPF